MRTKEEKGEGNEKQSAGWKPSWLSEEGERGRPAAKPVPSPPEATTESKPTARPSRLVEVSPGVLAASRSLWVEDLATVPASVARSEIAEWEALNYPVRLPAGVSPWDDEEGYKATKPKGGKQSGRSKPSRRENGDENDLLGGLD